MGEMKFFAYDNNHGFERFRTAEEARLWASSSIAQEKKTAFDQGEWSDDVDQLCWGEIKQVAVFRRCDFELDNIEVIDE